MENHCLKAVLHNGINSWTFRFTNQIDSPPPGTYDEKPNKLVAIPQNFKLDKIMLNTYKSGNFHALFQIKFFAIG